MRLAVRRANLVLAFRFRRLLVRPDQRTSPASERIEAEQHGADHQHDDPADAETARDQVHEQANTPAAADAAAAAAAFDIAARPAAAKAHINSPECRWHNVSRPHRLHRSWEIGRAPCRERVCQYVWIS